MKYRIIGLRYEHDVIFEQCRLAVTDNEQYAKMIVDALNDTDYSALFKFGSIPFDSFDYTIDEDKLDELAKSYVKNICGSGYTDFLEQEGEAFKSGYRKAKENGV